VIDFVRDTFKSTDFIPLHAPFFGSNEKKYLAECIDSTFVSSVGSFVSEIENELKNKLINDDSSAKTIIEGTYDYGFSSKSSGSKYTGSSSIRGSTVPPSAIYLAFDNNRVQRSGVLSFLFVGFATIARAKLFGFSTLAFLAVDSF
jgi:hypothetical protein